jgi:RNA polymerase sigma-32 factor
MPNPPSSSSKTRRRAAVLKPAAPLSESADSAALDAEVLDGELADTAGADEIADDPVDLLGEPEGRQSALAPDLGLPILDEDDDVLSASEVSGDDAPQSELGDLAGPARPTLHGGRSLVRSDPLTVYMHEIRRYPLLSREEEHQLAVEYGKTRDPKLARRLITANLRLVVKLAHEYKRAHRNILDLVQEGNLGLLQAVQKYDPHRGVKLSSYSAWWIRAYMLKYILNNWRLVKIGTTQAQRKLFFNLRKEREKLEAAGFVPTSKLLAERLSVPEQDVTEMQLRLSASEASLDTPVGRDDEGGRTHLDMLESPGDQRPDVSAESEQFRSLLREKLQTFEATLVGREQTLFHDRLVADQPLTLQEVGERYGISRERARQIEARLLGRLKVFLKKEMGDAVQVALGFDN